MNFHDIFGIPSPTKYNHQFDAFLAETKYLPEELINQLYDAYSYDRASTV